MASDEWWGSDAVYGIRLRGLGVSAVCKVVSAVWYNMARLLATKLVAAVLLCPFMGCEALMCHAVCKLAHPTCQIIR